MGWMMVGRIPNDNIYGIAVATKISRRYLLVSTGKGSGGWIYTRGAVR
jgi:hypothetical protein